MPLRDRARPLIRIALALGLAAAPLSACDSHSERIGDSPRQVTVIGSGHVQGVPDTLTADVGIEFTDPDVDTIGGFVTDYLGRLPHRGEVVTIGPVRFEVLRADARQVHVLLVRVAATLATDAT